MSLLLLLTGAGGEGGGPEPVAGGHPGWVTLSQRLAIPYQPPDWKAVLRAQVVVTVRGRVQTNDDDLVLAMLFGEEP